MSLHLCSQSVIREECPCSQRAVLCGSRWFLFVQVFSLQCSLPNEHSFGSLQRVLLATRRPYKPIMADRHRLQSPQSKHMSIRQQHGMVVFLHECAREPATRRVGFSIPYTRTHTTYNIHNTYGHTSRVFVRRQDGSLWAIAPKLW